jgi:hypothetical protein
MTTITFKRFVILVASAAAIAGLAQPAAAQGARSYAQSQISALSRENPGSAIVYASCRAVADDEYYHSGSVERALGALTACAGFGCAFTDSYQNCLSVNTRLFILELSLS